ncbi:MULTISPECIES: hypothetical protein [Leptospira]|uniref:Uncharacterized protein n=3 Tax=Leptospira weilii TaxID=28184 RepID=N1UAP1_9LEPT|nr:MULTISPECIES: hypothetical protein [Leptospira]EMM71081.1 hypothetical protein LEP1GSC038_1655 [Leptospira weilii str. 2006001855]EMY15291.1 hypothetical protein LEP1GSC043_0166 [Leptospira weilii str. Ecochallenge]EMJ64442.1 hypothetical protein LEP1GSC051_2732 [Leptospira sp. P2653]EMN91354.1 hypothetical protein LEP1GSC108_3109 [Leptospira weilii str. UI 13098]MCL8267814.1 hypothetical protein [Leptospira weilii]
MCFLPELIPKFHPVRFDPTLFKKAALRGYSCLRIRERTMESSFKEHFKFKILEYSLSMVLSRIKEVR